MEYEELKHLIAFVKYGTLSQAAKALHLSQPVLTRSMQHLEESLGVPLFNRTKNRIRLNETGKLLFELLQQGYTEQQMADRLAEEYELDSAQALADVQAFTEKLRSAGILHA